MIAIFLRSQRLILVTFGCFFAAFCFRLSFELWANLRNFCFFWHLKWCSISALICHISVLRAFFLTIDFLSPNFLRRKFVPRGSSLVSSAKLPIFFTKVFFSIILWCQIFKRSTTSKFFVRLHQKSTGLVGKFSVNLVGRVYIFSPGSSFFFHRYLGKYIFRPKKISCRRMEDTFWGPMKGKK